MSLGGLVNYNNDEKTNIILHTVGEMHIVALVDIIRLKAEGPYTEFHISDGRKIIVSKTIKEYEATLPSNQFYRCHNSHIINVDNISRIYSKDNIIEMKNGDTIDISRRRKDGLLNLFK